MKTYRYALSITSQFYFCGVPFRLDTTPKCSINCRYCFAMARGGRRTAQDLLVDSTAVLEKTRKALQTTDVKRDSRGEMLAHRMPLHFGGMSDPFSNRSASQKTLGLLQGLCDLDYPVVFSTKNTRQLMHPEVLTTIQRMKYIAIQISLCTCDNRVASLIEPNAPSPSERLEVIKELSAVGCFVIVRLQPLFLPLLRHNIDSLIPAVAEAGAKHVIVEFLKLPVEYRLSHMRQVQRMMEWSEDEFFPRHHAHLVGREWLLSNEFKWQNLKPLVNAIRQHGMTYGAGDYGLHHLGDTACCCGIDRLEGFSRWFEGNFSNTLREMSPGEVHFANVLKYWLPQGSIRMVMNSKCRTDETYTMEDFLRHKWNNPGTANAPDQFLGINWTGEYDDKGDCIYFKDIVQSF